MTSRDRVIRAIEFRKPEALPIHFESLGVDDTYCLRWKQIGAGDETKRESYDEWGCRWERINDSNMGQVKYHPLEDWRNYSHYTFPDPNDPELYEGMEEALAHHGKDKYIFIDIFMLLFERLHSLRGFTNVLMDFYEEPERIGELADRIVEYDLAIICNVKKRFPTQIQGFTCSDDWGTEQNTFISLEMWREFFKPRYARIFNVCKNNGWHVWLHSCGKINNFMEDFIDLGIQVLNLQQPRVLDIEEFGKQYAGRICFATLCDIQQTLPFKSIEEIREEARLLCRCWATPEGGLILMDDDNGEALGISMEKRQAMMEEFIKNDPYKV